MGLEVNEDGDFIRKPSTSPAKKTNATPVSAHFGSPDLAVDPWTSVQPQPVGDSSAIKQNHTRRRHAHQKAKPTFFDSEDARKLNGDKAVAHPPTTLKRKPSTIRSRLRKKPKVSYFPSDDTNALNDDEEAISPSPRHEQPTNSDTHHGQYRDAVLDSSPVKSRHQERREQSPPSSSCKLRDIARSPILQDGQGLANDDDQDSPTPKAKTTISTRLTKRKFGNSSHIPEHPMKNSILQMSSTSAFFRQLGEPAGADARLEAEEEGPGELVQLSQHIKPRSVAKSSFRRENSNNIANEGNNKKKRTLSFLSVAASVDMEPDRSPRQEKIYRSMRGYSLLGEEKKDQRQTSARRDKLAARHKKKVKISALELQEDGIDKGSTNDPFDIANVASSSGASPTAPESKAKTALRKQLLEKQPSVEHPVQAPRRIKVATKTHKRAKPTLVPLLDSQPTPDSKESHAKSPFESDDPSTRTAADKSTDTAPVQPIQEPMITMADQNAIEISSGSSQYGSEVFDMSYNDAEDEDYVEERLHPQTTKAATKPRQVKSAEAKTENHENEGTTTSNKNSHMDAPATKATEAIFSHPFLISDQEHEYQVKTKECVPTSQYDRTEHVERGHRHSVARELRATPPKDKYAISTVDATPTKIKQVKPVGEHPGSVQDEVVNSTKHNLKVPVGMGTRRQAGTAMSAKIHTVLDDVQDPHQVIEFKAVEKEGHSPTLFAIGGSKADAGPRCDVPLNHQPAKVLSFATSPDLHDLPLKSPQTDIMQPAPMSSEAKGHGHHPVVDDPDASSIPDSLEQADDAENMALHDQPLESTPIAAVLKQASGIGRAGIKRPSLGGRNEPQDPDTQHTYDRVSGDKEESKRPRIDGAPTRGLLSLAMPHARNSRSLPTDVHVIDDVPASPDVHEHPSIDYTVVKRLRGLKAGQHAAMRDDLTFMSHAAESAIEPVKLQQAHPHPVGASRGYLGQTSAKRIQTVHPSYSGKRHNANEHQSANFGRWNENLADRRQQMKFNQGEKYSGQLSDRSETLEDVMHRIVKGVLRELRAREDPIQDVVENYRVDGSKVVRSISKTHEDERRRLFQQFEKSRLDYIDACEKVRNHVVSLATHLQAVDPGKTMAHRF
ncbi:hypothetical protein M406DRAFT_333115 [Cryphonectria parasitica EP155]|uniref:Uncharacterized protein n=1 Tax=Cryphonectria parasitica (strain ATCC 38755 / EP155) TaxID=660469 RepID=A0A9P4XXM4_CRYP1|nr:uncharacterized protein M406DRAFT_333115 [Cryphonectria parasitica EP155]KAF3762746.1 hypothetical protein M406DRAFT_333115 [Cryphonectria parasitica EP155]